MTRNSGTQLRFEEKQNLHEKISELFAIQIRCREH